MLGKLIKHEFKATYRIFLMFYSILAVFTLIGKLVVTTGLTENELVNGLLISVYIIYIVALFIATMLYLIFRYYKNLFSDEGYLMFTLPAKPMMLFWSKLIASFVWNLSTLLLTVGSIAFLLIQAYMIKEIGIGYRIVDNFVKSELGMNMAVLIFIIILTILIAIIYQMVVVYTSINIGQLAGKHRILGSVAAYMIIYITMQTLSTIFTFAKQWFTNTNFGTMEDASQIFNFVLPYSLGVSTVLTIIFIIISCFILNRKLNLE